MVQYDRERKPPKIRVLLAAHIGEPRGGVSTYYEAILNSGLPNSVELHFLETSKGSLQSGDRGKWKFANWVNALANILRFLSALVSIRPDLVHIGTAYGASFAKHGVMVCIARLFCIPVILQPHCSFYKLVPSEQGVWRRYALFILRRCAGIIILSREWEALSGLIPGLRIRYIPNAIEIGPYQKLPRPRENPDGAVNILYLGHLVREKGVCDLIDAAAVIAAQNRMNFRVDLVGESINAHELAAIEASITNRNAGEIVHIYPPVYGKEKIARFAAADILVLPSYHEGMPMTVLEAMAAGLPVAASRVGGIPDLVDDRETGFLVDPGDAPGLADRLDFLITHPDERLALGGRGRKKAVRSFGMDVHVSRLVSFYREIVSANEAPATGRN